MILWRDKILDWGSQSFAQRTKCSVPISVLYTQAAHLALGVTQGKGWRPVGELPGLRMMVNMWEGPGEHTAKGGASGKLSRECPTDTELFCFVPQSPSGWGTWSCPIWTNWTIWLRHHPTLSISQIKLVPGIWTRWQDAICTQKCAASRLSRVTLATTILLGISGEYMNTENRERGCLLHWKLAHRVAEEKGQPPHRHAEE